MSHEFYSVLNLALVHIQKIPVNVEYYKVSMSRRKEKFQANFPFSINHFASSERKRII